MNKQLMAIGIASVLIGTLSTANFVSAQKLGTSKSSVQKNNDAKTTRATPRAIGGADAPSARLAALIDGGIGSFTVVRSKGVALVTRPSGGLYCIQPSVSLNVNTIVPIVSVDFSLSEGSGSLVQYRSTGSGCPSGNIAVRTFSQGELSGQFFSSDRIAFTIVVP